jgi:2-(1,2-epoxy-1,2-dihydrophenyl)acetyl-CoA isomerase
MTELAVRFEETDTVGALVLDRPHSGNAVTPDFIAAFSSALDAVEGSPIRVLKIRSQGPNFCVGADLRHFASRLDQLPVELAAMADNFHSALARLTELSIPVVAQVQGAAVGAGLGLMLAADCVICAENARLSTGYAKLGLSADAGVSYFLTRTLGVRRARSLLMTARAINSTEALSLGLCDEICPTADLSTRADALAGQLAGGSRGAAAAVKRLTKEAAANTDLRTHLDRERDEIVLLSCDERFAAAVQAFASRS